MTTATAKVYAMPVLISRLGETSYRAECTILPGCFVDGESLEEVISDIQEAIALYVQASKERGLSLPEMVETSGSQVLTVIPVAIDL